MEPGQRLQVEVGPEQRPKFERMLAHRAGRVLDEEAMDNGCWRLLVEKE
jgi:hypothetical protein